MGRCTPAAASLRSADERRSLDAMQFGRYRYMCVHIYMSVWVSVSVCGCVGVWVWVCICVCARARVCVCACVYMLCRFGLPAAIGAKLALPDHVVIDIDGDASYCMTGMELMTAAQCGERTRVYTRSCAQRRTSALDGAAAHEAAWDCCSRDRSADSETSRRFRPLA
jgi:hypothetical protein